MVILPETDGERMVGKGRVEWGAENSYGNLLATSRLFIDLGTTDESRYVWDMTPAEWYGVSLAYSLLCKREWEEDD